MGRTGSVGSEQGPAVGFREHSDKTSGSIKIAD